MATVLDIKNMPDFFMQKPVSVEQISAAERELNVHFAPEFRNYLLTFGCASVNGHEFTGLCTAERLDVVAVTKEERGFCSCIPENMYVVEQTHYDDIVIWQSVDGAIYQTRCNSVPEKISDSLYDYLKG